MRQEYSQSSTCVKSQSSLTGYSYGSNFTVNNTTGNNLKMNFGERLLIARNYAKLTQEELAIRSGVKQGTISKIERGDADSSTFTVQLAIACGVRAEWLAIEQGDMVDGLYVEDERIKRGVMILEQMKAEYRLDDALDLLYSAAKLTHRNGNDKK